MYRAGVQFYAMLRAELIVRIIGKECVRRSECQDLRHSVGLVLKLHMYVVLCRNMCPISDLNGTFFFLTGLVVHFLWGAFHLRQ